MNIAACIDHTVLKPDTTLQEIQQWCREAVRYHFAAVCVPPPFVRIARELLSGSGISTATVIGFPFGYSAVEAKMAEIILAIVDGADELDVVANILAIKNNDWPYIEKEISTIMPVIRNKGKLIKVIIESGLLTDEEIVHCCNIYGKHQVDFVKTSTGYAGKGATPETVRLMRQNLPASVQVKASGGIRTFEMAKLLIEAGATRLGCSASVAIAEESKADL